MTSEEQVELAALLVGVAESMGEQASDARLEVFTNALNDLPLDVVRAALDEHVRRVKFFPRPAEIRTLARQAQRHETRQALLTGTVQAEPSIEPRHLQEAVYDYLRMRSEGVSREDAERGFEGMLRAFIVPGRERPWRAECSACDDSGWEVRTCYPDQGPACGVEYCKRVNEHTFAVACSCRETNRTYQRNRARGW